jgi:hypothetical protein
MKRFILTSVFLSSLLALMATVFFASSVSATTYYIATSGSDSNNGTSKSTPWAHLPGMQTWQGTHTPVAGDTFILRGCDDWPNASFPINWNWNGTSGNPITIDRDTTWYNTATCSSAWNRPKFDAGTAIINPPECQGTNAFWTFGTVSYVNVNWIELINYYWTSPQAGGSCYGNEYMVGINTDSSNVNINNWYVHKWTLASGADDNDHAFYQGCQTCVVNYLVANNSDGTQYTGIGMQWPTRFSIFNYVANAIKPNMSGEYAYNNISNVNNVIPSVHTNCIETIPDIVGNGIFYIHDNIIHDNGSCEGLQVGNPGETDYVWNNLWYNNTSVGANGPDVPQNDNNTVALYYFNNTNVDSDVACVRTDAPGKFWSSAFVMVNNHCITGGTPGGTTQSQGMMNQTVSGATTILFGNNVVESLATANSKGYTNTETYVYSPTSATSPTVGAGQNLTTTYWPAGFSINDTTYSCTQQTVNGVVESVCPARTPNPRPTSGAWDAGAYQFSTAASKGEPAPPTGVTAVAH